MTSEFPRAFELHVKSELSEVDLEQRFCDMLDECYSFESIGGPFAYMSPSAVLKEMSPTDFRIGVSEQSDADDDNLYDIDGEYYDSREVDDLFEDWKADQPACKHCGSNLIKVEDQEPAKMSKWLNVDSWTRRTADVCSDNDDKEHEPDSEDDDSDE